MLPPMTVSVEFKEPLTGRLPQAPAEAGARVHALEPVAVLARSRTTETAVVDLPDFGRIVRKRRWWPDLRDRVRGALRTTVTARSPARREFDALDRLRGLSGGPFAPASNARPLR